MYMILSFNDNKARYNFQAEMEMTISLFYHSISGCELARAYVNFDYIKFYITFLKYNEFLHYLSSVSLPFFIKLGFPFTMKITGLLIMSCVQFGTCFCDSLGQNRLGNNRMIHNFSRKKLSRDSLLISLMAEMTKTAPGRNAVKKIINRFATKKTRATRGYVRSIKK